MYLFDQVMILFDFFSIFKCDVRIKHNQIDEMIPSKSSDESPNPTIWLYRPVISSLVSICSGVCFTVAVLRTLVYVPNLSPNHGCSTDEPYISTGTYYLTRMNDLSNFIYCNCIETILPCPLMTVSAKLCWAINKVEATSSSEGY